MLLGQANGVSDEPPMYLQKPSSIKSQDVTHVLARTFRELFTKDPIDSDTIQYLNASRCGEDAYHERYVGALQQIKEEREKRLAEAAMLERHILQAQARALSADEREANRIASNHKGFPDVCIPPARAHFRSCVDSELLKKHNLISPEDFSSLRVPVVPPPSGPTVPHYALDSRPERKGKSKKKDCNRPQSQPSDIFLDHRPAESEFDYDEYERKSANSSPAFLETALWKKQISVPERLVCRMELGNLQDKVDHSKNPRHKSPGDLLIKKSRKKRKEIGIKPPPSSEDVGLPVFIAIPSTVTFSDYKVGQVYEIMLHLKNVTTVLRPIRVIPPSTSYFSVSLGQFPAEHGLVAPGMSCIYAIRFSPDSLSDFDDVLTVQTQSDSPLLVQLQGRRPAPVLTVPKVLDVGHCLVNGVKVGQFILKNEGGPGRFCLIPSAAWPSGNFKSYASAPHVQMDPFEVKPSIFQLESGEMTTLEVLFAPKSLDIFTQSLVVVCDNCHVKELTISGESRTTKVELMTVEGGLSDYDLGEMMDVTAQHFIRFPRLNPYTYMQKTFTVHNCINVELAYCWMIVHPHHVSQTIVEDPDTAAMPVTIPQERIQDIDPAFCIEPDTGVLPPGGTSEFTLTFAPPLVREYDSCLHMVLRYFLQSQSDQNYICKTNEQHWASKSLMPPGSQPVLNEVTSLEIETKGICEAFRVAIQPCLIHIPGQILLETTIKKSFTMLNESLSSVVFQWINVHNSYILGVEPPMGEIMPQSEVDLELSITGSIPGKIDHLLLCHLRHVEEPLTLQVIADIKGPELTIEQPDINFGLIQLGNEAKSSLTLRNFSRIPAKWTIREHDYSTLKTDCKYSESLSEYIFDPQCGEIKPLDAAVIEITFRPTFCKSVKTMFEISVTDGGQSVVPVYSEVQKTCVCFMECHLDIPDAFLDVPLHRSVVLVNQTLFPTPFEWGQVVQLEEDADLHNCTIEMEPRSGILQPRQHLTVDVCFTGHTMGDYTNMVIPCKIKGMDNVICLALTAIVTGLSVSYSIADDISVVNREVEVDNLFLNFGNDNKLGTSPKRFIFIKNNTGMTVPYSVNVEYYASSASKSLKPPTPPEKKLPSDQLQRSQRKVILGRTANLADPVPKTKEQIRADICKSMLADGRGAAFHVNQKSEILEPFVEEIIEVTGYSDMWGTYTDRIMCNVGSLDVVSIPLQMNVVGCPLYFTMVNPKTEQKPIIRFGTHTAGTPTVTRPARIMNTSPVDVGIDWKMFNVCSNDNQMLDLVVSYGQLFPRENQLESDIPQDENSSPSCLNESPERKSACLTDASNSDKKRPKIISVNTRIHGGRESFQPFSIDPIQIVIPAFGSKSIDVRFTPQQLDALNVVSSNIDCTSYALGYLSLNHKERVMDKVLCRTHQYHVSPIRIDMTATILPGQLSVLFEDDDKMQFQLAASDLLQDDGNLKPIFMKVSGIVLCNRTTTPLAFHIISINPFSVVQLDQTTNKPLSQVMNTDLISLDPYQNALIHVAFCLTPDLVEYLNSQSYFIGGRMPEGISFQEIGSERKLIYERELSIEFTNRTVQRVPLYATLVVPTLDLSTNLVDFGACFVGQTREIQISLLNCTTSDSVWSCFQESTLNDCAEAFEIIPRSGKLDAQVSFISNSKTLIKIFFTAKYAEPYEAVYVFQGILGEQRRRLLVKGQGSHDGHFEAIVNI